MRLLSPALSWRLLGKPLEAIKPSSFHPERRFWIGRYSVSAYPDYGYRRFLMLRSGQFNMLGKAALHGRPVAAWSPFTFRERFLAVLLASLAGIWSPSIRAGSRASSVDEFVVSLMLNFIMLWLGMYFLQTFSGKGFRDIATRIIQKGTASNPFQGTYLRGDHRCPGIGCSGRLFCTRRNPAISSG